MTRIPNGERIVSSINWMTTCKRIKLDPYPGMPWIQQSLSHGCEFGFDYMATKVKGSQQGEHDLIDVIKYPSFCEETVPRRDRVKTG